MPTDLSRQAIDEHTHAWQEGSEQARLAGRAIAEAVLPFLVLDITSLGVLGLRRLVGHCC